MRINSKRKILSKPIPSIYITAAKLQKKNESQIRFAIQLKLLIYVSKVKNYLSIIEEILKITGDSEPEITLNPPVLKKI